MNENQTPTLPRSIGSSSSVVLPPINNVDPSIVKVLHAIRQVESNNNYNAVGDNGSSYGAFQWNNGKTPLKEGETPINWQNAAKEFLGTADAPMTPENQNYVAYQQIAKYKAQGLSPISIDALWNGAHADPNNPGQYVHNAPERLAKFQQALQSGIDTSQDNQSLSQPQQQETPSVGGFGENVIKSGANFLGNIGSAIIHPLDTLQGLGSTAVGGLQELGGQTNENTARFDNLTNFFKERYGSMDKLLHTAYTDPVGLAADISAIAGIGGGIIGAVGKGAEVAGLGNVARLATETTPAIEGAGIAGKIGQTGKALGAVSEYTNPLTPVVKLGGAMINKATNISDILKNPQDYTPENIANSSASKIGEDVQAAFDSSRSALRETGAGYNALRETPVTMTVSPAFLDSAIREIGKLKVEDGVISATGSSLIRDTADINELQRIYNLYKPYFLNGKISSDEFLNLRSDLADVAKYGKGTTSNIQRIGADLRTSLNDSYREQVPGLSAKDLEYSTKLDKINELEDGLVYKTGIHKGEIKDSFMSRANKAFKTGNDAQLAQLEEVLPGITKRLQIMKTIQDLSKPSFTTSLIEKGGVLGGLATGNLQLAATAFSAIILQNPELAVPLMRAIGANLPLVKAVMANLAKYATISSVGNNAITTPSPQETTPSAVASQQEQTQSVSESPTQQNQNNVSSSTDTTTISPTLQALADVHKFDIQKAIKDGVSVSEIEQYLINKK